MLVANAQDDETPIGKIYRVNVKELSSGEMIVKTVTASDPDAALDRIMDMLTQGYLSPEEFWDRYKVTAIAEELK